MAAGIGGGGSGGGGLASVGTIGSIGSITEMSTDVGSASDAGAASANAAIDTSFDSTPVDASMDMSAPSMLDMAMSIASMDLDQPSEVTLDEAMSGPTDPIGGATEPPQDEADLTDVLSMQLDTQMYQSDPGGSGGSGAGDVSAQVAATYASWSMGDAAS